MARDAIRLAGVLLALGACASQPRAPAPEEACVFTEPLVDPIARLSDPVPLAEPRPPTETCAPEPGSEAILEWTNTPSWLGGRFSAFEVRGGCVVGTSDEGTFRAPIDAAELGAIAGLVPRGRVTSRAYDAAMTRVHVRTAGRDDESVFPTGTTGGVFPTGDLGLEPSFAILERRLANVERRVLAAPYCVVEVRLLPPAGVVRDEKTRVHVVLENRGRVPTRIRRDRNAVVVWSGPERCERSRRSLRSPCEVQRASVAMPTAVDIELPVGTEREVELDAYVHLAGAAVAYATVSSEGTRSTASSADFVGSTGSSAVRFEVAPRKRSLER